MSKKRKGKEKEILNISESAFDLDFFESQDLLKKKKTKKKTSNLVHDEFVANLLRANSKEKNKVESSLENNYRKVVDSIPQDAGLYVPPHKRNQQDNKNKSKNKKKKKNQKTEAQEIVARNKHKPPTRNLFGFRFLDMMDDYVEEKYSSNEIDDLLEDGINIIEFAQDKFVDEFIVDTISEDFLESENSYFEEQKPDKNYFERRRFLDFIQYFKIYEDRFFKNHDGYKQMRMNVYNSIYHQEKFLESQGLIKSLIDSNLYVKKFEKFCDIPVLIIDQQNLDYMNCPLLDSKFSVRLENLCPGENKVFGHYNFSDIKFKLKNKFRNYEINKILVVNRFDYVDSIYTKYKFKHGVYLNCQFYCEKNFVSKNSLEEYENNLKNMKEKFTCIELKPGFEYNVIKFFLEKEVFLPCTVIL